MLLHFGNLRGIFIYTAEIPPSPCYGAAPQFDSLCSLRMTRRGASHKKVLTDMQKEYHEHVIPFSNYRLFPTPL